MKPPIQSMVEAQQEMASVKEGILRLEAFFTGLSKIFGVLPNVATPAAVPLAAGVNSLITARYSVHTPATTVASKVLNVFMEVRRPLAPKEAVVEYQKRFSPDIEYRTLYTIVFNAMVYLRKQGKIVKTDKGDVLAPPTSLPVTSSSKEKRANKGVASSHETVPELGLKS